MTKRDIAVVAYIALGSNLGDPVQEVLRAIDAIAGIGGVEVLSCSPLYGSAPVDASGPDYVNAVIAVTCRLDVCALLRALQGVETQAGRTRLYRNAPRTLDLDILLYGTAQVDSAFLTVPHPRMYERAFVLYPLADIAPEMVTPQQMASVSLQSLRRLPEKPGFSG